MVLITILRSFGVIFLLGLWRSHLEYQEFLVENLLPIYLSDKKRVSHHANILAKLFLLDLDRITPFLDQVYSHTGTPAKYQPEIFRSFVLMSGLHELSISKWVAKLKSDSLLAVMIGVHPDEVPEVGNHYDLIN